MRDGIPTSRRGFIIYAHNLGKSEEEILNMLNKRFPPDQFKTSHQAAINGTLWDLNGPKRLARESPSPVAALSPPPPKNHGTPVSAHISIASERSDIAAIVKSIEQYIEYHAIPGIYQKWLDRYRIPPSDRDDAFLFEMLVQAMFSAGMSGEIVDNKMPQMKEIFDKWDVERIAQYTDDDIERRRVMHQVIGHRSKLKAIVTNARKVLTIRKNHGSFGKYLYSFNNDYDRLTGALTNSFSWIKHVTVHDFLRNIGFETIKPDRHVTRWLTRMGFLSIQEASEEKVRSVASEVAKRIGISLPRLDAIIYLFCADRHDVIDRPVCGDQPACRVCPVANACPGSG